MSIKEAMELNNEVEWLECAMHLEAMLFTLEPAHMPEMIEYIKGAGFEFKQLEEALVAILENEIKDCQ